MKRFLLADWATPQVGVFQGEGKADMTDLVLVTSNYNYGGCPPPND
ncbi:MAG: hypothetical protein M1299_09020 [Firmicutes bacterium]|nr:hypothetical protein [Bacillota bacterium]